MLVRALSVHIAHETSGAARIRHSLRPLYFRGRKLLVNLGPIGPRECGGVPSVIASAAKQSMAAKRKNGLLRFARNDDFWPTPRAAISFLRWRSRRLRRLQPELRLDRIAHQEFLNLAGHRHRKFVDELDI